MSSDSASSEVTYTSISSHGDPLAWAVDFFRLQEPDSPEDAPASPDYVPGPEEPEQAPLLPDYMRWTEIQGDPEEDSEDGLVYYPADGGDGDDDDSSDDDKEEEEASEEEVKEEEEEHLALADSLVAPVVDHVPSSEETEPFETNEARKDYQHLSLDVKSMEARIAEYAVAPTPPSPPPFHINLASLFIPPLVDRREDTPEAELPPCKRLCLTALTSRYDVGESSTAAPRPAGGHGIDYRQTRIFQSVETLIDDRQYHYETARLLDQEALVSREAWAYFMGFSSAVNYELQGYRTHAWMQDHRIDRQDSLIAALTAQVSSLQGHLAMALGEIQSLQARDQARADAPEGTASTTVGLVFSFLVSDNHNNMPPRRSSATARAATAAAPMTVAAVKQLIEARVSAALANHETLRNSTNGHGDGSHNSGIGNRGTTCTLRECTYKDFLNCHPLNFKGTEGVVVLAQWFEKMESVVYKSNCVVENQVKFATCTFHWKYPYMVELPHEGCYSRCYSCHGLEDTKEDDDSQILPKGMFHEESDEVEKYVGGLPDMIRGNVMSYRPKTMEEAIEFANDQMDQKVLTISERQAEQKRKKEYAKTLPLCNKCKFHHHGPCTVKCANCKKVGHLTRDCWNPTTANHQRTITCYECGNQGHYKSDCPELENRNHGNQAEGTEARGMAYALGGEETNQDLDNIEDDINA
ncbi:reverse transcriptase domain-containing protein [Tanacetum coccineum]